MKHCWKCARDLAEAEFFRDRSRRDGLDPICKRCRNAKEKARRQADPEKWAAIVRAWQHRNPEKVKQMARTTYERNPEGARLRMQRRRALRFAAKGVCTAEQVAARVAYYGGKCWMCRVKPWECLDHVIPLSKGGAHWPSNLRPACTSCNSRKGSKRLARNPVEV